MRANERIAYQMETALEDALQHLSGVETLQERKSDELDFHDVSVWSLKAALEAAYKAGRKDEMERAERVCRRNARR